MIHSTWGLKINCQRNEPVSYLEIIVRIVQCSVEGNSGSSIQVLMKGVGSSEVHHLVQRLCLRRKKVFSGTAKYKLLDKHRFNFNVRFLSILGVKTKQST